MSFRKVLSIFGSDSKKKAEDHDSEENHYSEEDSTDREMNDVAKWVLKDRKLLKEAADFVKKSEADVKKILKDPYFAKNAYNEEEGYIQVWDTIAELKSRDEYEQEYEEDSTSREMLNAAKEFLNNRNLLNELITKLKMSKKDIKKILKDPEFAKKSDLSYNDYLDVSNAIYEIKVKHADEKEAKHGETKSNDANNGIYGSISLKHVGTNKKFI